MSLHREQLWARAEELLGDGEWHNYEQVIRELGKVIPPGVAMRKQERERIGEGTSQRRGRPAPAERKVYRDVNRMIESGRRSMVRIFLKSPRFEKDMHGDPNRRLPERRIRMVPLP